MNFDYTPKVKEMQERLLAFFDQHIYPNEQRFYEEIEAVEPVPAPLAARAGRPVEPGIRPAVRDHGPRALGAGSVQLLCAGHRQHGNDRRQGRQEAHRSQGQL